MFRIGEFARINKVSVKTLRHYDNIGLLQPEKINSFTGYRYYSADQMPKLNRILSLKDIGFSLEDIALILKKNMNSEQMQLLLEAKHFEIKEKIKNEQARLYRIEAFMKFNKEEINIMKYDVVLKNIESIRVAAIRDFIPNYDKQEYLWHELGDYIEQKNVKIVPPCMAIYYDTGHNEDSIDAEVIEPIAGELSGNERIKVRNLEEISEAACVVHKGSYETLHLAYNAISKWIQENKYVITGPQRELYLKGHWITNDPNEYITEIQFPVNKIK